ncbi:MAG: metallophosphoesterase [Aggregatilineales bacterium]
MQLIALPDLHNGGKNFLPRLKDELSQVDLLLLPGDITNGSRFAETLSEIMTYNPNVLAIPGNWERSQDIVYMQEQGIGLHRTHRIVDNIAFYGVGGALPYIGHLEFSEDQLGGFAQDAVKALPPELPEIFVCHHPPYNTLNDRNHSNNHVGSHDIREFIEQRQPLICFTGHIHEGVGIDTIGRTQIINPGPIWQAECYAYAEIINSEVKMLEIRQL